MSDELTPWFVHTKAPRPARSGVYLTRPWEGTRLATEYPEWRKNGRYQWYDATLGRWTRSALTPDDAFALRAYIGAQMVDWRGLTLESAYPFELAHHSGCGLVGFRYTHTPERGEVLRSANAVTHDGKPVTPHTELKCPRCGGAYSSIDLLSRPKS